MRLGGWERLRQGGSSQVRGHEVSVAEVSGLVLVHPT